MIPQPNALHLLPALEIRRRRQFEGHASEVLPGLRERHPTQPHGGIMDDHPDLQQPNPCVSAHQASVQSASTQRY
ncbi:hypothetical protein [Hydrogenophaga borbori]|uniref:hypothetical protein n=1 Tax=Hydrogenophaga borbori TaxID=2294117 RepID=UPI00301B8E87